MGIGLLVVLLIGIWLYAFVWKRIVADRVDIRVEVLEEVVDWGDAVTIRCRLRNHSPIPCPYANWRIQLPTQLYSGREDDPHFIDLTVSLPRFKETVIEVKVRAAARGVARLSAASVLLTEGFGLRRIVQQLDVNGRVIVRPRNASIIPIPQTMRELLGNVRVQRFYQDDPSLFVGVRPYASGDSLRRISWAHTARTQELVTKQFGYTSTCSALILLAGTDPLLFDALCERVVKIAEAMLKSGIPTGMLTNRLDTINRDFLLPPSLNPSQLDIMRTRMGSVEDVPMLTFASLLRSVPRVTESQDMIILVSDELRADDAVELMRLQRERPNMTAYFYTKDASSIHYVDGVRILVERREVAVPAQIDS